MALLTAACLTPALVNGTPPVFTDTQSYLDNMNRFRPSHMRAFGYGAFLRLTGGLVSLWLPVFVQAVLSAWLVLRFLALEQARWPRRWQGPLILAAVALLLAGPLPWLTSWLDAGSLRRLDRAGAGLARAALAPARLAGTAGADRLPLRCGQHPPDASAPAARPGAGAGGAGAGVAPGPGGGRAAGGGGAAGRGHRGRVAGGLQPPRLQDADDLAGLAGVPLRPAAGGQRRAGGAGAPLRARARPG